jgi:hypothetical protein
MKSVESNGAFSLVMQDTPQCVVIVEQITPNLNGP